MSLARTEIFQLQNSLLFIALLTLVSCTNSRKVAYFSGIADSTMTAKLVVPETIIQKNDILSITVSSLNAEATILFNSPNSVPGPNGVQINGYLVNNDGILQFPVLGNIKAEGLTKERLRATIAESLVTKKLLVDPIVTVRFQNFRVTVLGEVKNPSVIPVPNEKISLLEALGLAGDLTIYAKRDNVMVIREDENGKVIKRVNLNSTELFSSPFYYLKSNDIVYVEHGKSKVASASQSQVWLPVVFGALTFATIVVDRILRN